MIAEDLIFIIKKMAASDIKELGPESSQDTYLCSYITRALKELAHIAYQDRVSDVLTINSDGYQNFLRNGNAVDMYSPLYLLDSSGNQVKKRTSFDAPLGWWRESGTSKIHTKGLSGDFTLHYISYPADVNSISDEIEFPEAGMMGLAFYVCGIVKESANEYDESREMYNRAQERLRFAVAANEYGRGIWSGGWLPGGV